MKSDELRKQLEAARAKRKPELTEAEKAEREECAKLMAELEEERRQLRLEENADIMAKYCPDKSKAFFDFDPDGVHPAQIEHNGRTCALFSRFVVKHASADDMSVFEDAATGKPNPQAVDSTLRKLASKCIVFPEPVKGEGSAQHHLDIQASLHYFGGASLTLGNKAAELGGMMQAAHQAKS